MDQHLENKVIRRLDPEKFLAYDKMSAAADREEFSKSLHKPEYDCFKPFHNDTV